MMSGKAMRKVAFALLGLALLREVAGHRHGCRYEDEEGMGRTRSTHGSVMHSPGITARGGTCVSATVSAPPGPTRTGCRRWSRSGTAACTRARRRGMNV